MPKQIVKYECDICHKKHSNETQALKCESIHTKAKKIVEQHFNMDDGKFKFPDRIVVELTDGSRLSYYRSESEAIALQNRR